MRTRTKAETAQYKARIVELVTARPMASAEIADAIGVGGCSLGNYFTLLLREGKISRHQWRKGQYRYYPGQTAPDVPYKVQKPEPPAPKPRMQYAIPVKRVIVRPFSIAGENGTAAPVTLPAAPWEVCA